MTGCYRLLAFVAWPSGTGRWRTSPAEVAARYDGAEDHDADTGHDLDDHHPDLDDEG
jgi:hypothetical protein